MSEFCEIPEFYSVNWPKARKVHICCECGSDIFIGEKYCSVSAKWGGVVRTERQHLECEEACRYYRDFINHECLYFGELFEYQCEIPNKNSKHKDVRTIWAKVIWRGKKNRPLSFIKTKEIENKSLYEDRKRGYLK